MGSISVPLDNTRVNKKPEISGGAVPKILDDLYGKTNDKHCENSIENYQ
jgi:hypothetical protein